MWADVAWYSDSHVCSFSCCSCLYDCTGGVYSASEVEKHLVYDAVDAALSVAPDALQDVVVKAFALFEVEAVH